MTSGRKGTEAIGMGEGQMYPPITDPWRLGAYGIDRLDENRGRGINKLRTENAAQPRALTIGDVLLTGEPVVEMPVDGANGGVVVALGRDDGWITRIEVAARIPIALRSRAEG